MALKNAHRGKLLAAALALATFMVVVQASDQQSPLTDKERQLADLIN